MTKIKYEKDFYAWAIQNAQLLKNGRLTEVDIMHVAEEIESMGKSEKRELINRLVVLIAHLLKWQYQPIRRSRSWELTIQEQRIEILELLEDSPSLKGELDKQFISAYDKALLMAEKETGLARETFSNECPFTLKQIFNEQFYPQ